ncbi:MAG: DUF1565 domain-containing protein [Candidatus Woesebacteria bacterium]|nr:MAG: DUF1565 domain-containing protein [Candidatus Woesebacteria bacterium]
MKRIFLFLILVFFFLFLFPRKALASTYYVNTNSGNDGNLGTQQTSAWKTITKAISSIKSGDTVMIASGIYRISSVSFGPAGTSSSNMTIFKSEPGARVIFSTDGDLPPPVHVASYTRLESMWFGGKANSGNAFFTGGSPVSNGIQLVNNTLFGYNGISQGSAEYTFYQGNRFILMGNGRFDHGLYISGGYTVGQMATHTIVDNNILIGGEGYGIHGWHNTHDSIVTRNFVTGHFWGLVMDGSDHLIANNFFWKMTGQAGREGPWGPWLAGANTYLINNILGPNGYAWTSGNTTNTITNNAFLSSPLLGSQTITLTRGQEAQELGLSEAEIDSNISSIKQAFSSPISDIFSNQNIEGYFSKLRMVVPSGSPLYGSGRQWFGQVVNVGPNSLAPTSVDGFWNAFRALGLRDWDRFGNVATNTPSPTLAPTSSPIPTSPDVNGDGKVDGIDYMTVVIHFGQTTTNGARDGDVNADGKVDINDLNLIISKIS